MENLNYLVAMLFNLIFKTLRKSLRSDATYVYVRVSTKTFSDGSRVVYFSSFK